MHQGRTIEGTVVRRMDPLRRGYLSRPGPKGAHSNESHAQYRGPACKIFVQE